MVLLTPQIAEVEVEASQIELQLLNSVDFQTHDYYKDCT